MSSLCLLERSLLLSSKSTTRGVESRLHKSIQQIPCSKEQRGKHLCAGVKCEVEIVLCFFYLFLWNQSEHRGGTRLCLLITHLCEFQAVRRILQKLWKLATKTESLRIFKKAETWINGLSSFQVTITFFWGTFLSAMRDI